MENAPGPREYFDYSDTLSISYYGRFIVIFYSSIFYIYLWHFAAVLIRCMDFGVDILRT